LAAPTLALLIRLADVLARRDDWSYSFFVRWLGVVVVVGIAGCSGTPGTEQLGGHAGGSGGAQSSGGTGGSDAGRPMLRVLFVGNSYTYVNDVPSLLAKISSSVKFGPLIETDSLVEGGQTLAGHLMNPEVASRIAEGGWTHVVIQGQSLEFAPAEPAAQLGQMVVDADATPTWFVTWARAPESPEYDSPTSWVHYFNNAEMQDYATHSYVQAAEHTPGSLLSCVGEAFRLSLAEHPEITLHQSDWSHATLQGSYLAASTFYVALTGEPVPAEASVPDGISTSEAAALRESALVGSSCADVHPHALTRANVVVEDFGVSALSIPAVLVLDNRGPEAGTITPEPLAVNGPFQWTNGTFPGGLIDSTKTPTFCPEAPGGSAWQVPAETTCLVSVSFSGTSTANAPLVLNLGNDYRPTLEVALSGIAGSATRALLTISEDGGYVGCSDLVCEHAEFEPGDALDFVVTNRGGAPTTTLGPGLPLEGSFEWVGGTFPGGTGSKKLVHQQTATGGYADPDHVYPYCGGVLAPGAQCIVSLTFTATPSGFVPSIPIFTAETDVNISYADGVGPALENANRHLVYHPPAG
jgi:hypothetical protein